MAKQQTARMEDYLEAIHLLAQEEGTAKVSSLAKRLGVKMPSVNAAVNKLVKQGLIDHSRYGDVRLTSSGEKMAAEVNRRHNMLARFFSLILGIEESMAQTDACKVEHVLSANTMSRLTSFVEFITEAPHRPEWLEHYFDYHEHGRRPVACESRFRCKY